MIHLTKAERERFARLYDEHVWHVYGFLGYRVGSRTDAEDLTQLTFERALRSWDRFDPNRASARTWLISIARNLLIDHYRRDRFERSELVGDPHSDSELPQLHHHDPELGLSPELADALGKLSKRDREVIAFRFGADLTGPEIAELTGLSLANVQQIFSRSLRKLRLEIERPSPRDATRHQLRAQAR